MKAYKGETIKGWAVLCENQKAVSEVMINHEDGVNSDYSQDWLRLTYGATARSIPVTITIRPRKSEAKSKARKVKHG